MKSGFFVTKYGDRIDFIPGYFDLFPDLIVQYKDTIATFDDLSQHLKDKGQDKQSGKTPPVQGAGYLSRHARTAKMIEMLNKYGIARKFDSVLDIGTGYGIMPRLMKAYGLVDKAYGLDLADCTHFISSRQVLGYERELARTKRTDALKALFNMKQTDWSRRASQAEFGFAMNQDNFFPKVVTSNIDLNGLIIEDLYKQEQKHDLITTFGSLCCFDSERMMQKVSDLLEDGGVFFVYVNLWWYPINSTLLVAHFPYAHCRMERDDWERYVKEFHPDHFAQMNRLYDVIDSKHPTVSKYIETAAKNGLTLLGYERCIHTQPHDPRSRFSPNHIEDFFQKSYLSEVLSNIHRFRNDVSIEDLQTSHVFMAFQKRGKPLQLCIDHDFIKKSRAPLDEYRGYSTIKAIKTPWARVRNSAISAAAKYLPPTLKAQIKRHIPWAITVAQGHRR